MEMLAQTYLSWHLVPLLCETSLGYRSLPILRQVSSSGVSTLSVLSLMVPENQMPGGVSTAASIPLHGFLPMDDVE